MPNYDITIISDTVCPHCYLGRARLERTISLFRKTVPGASASTFTIRWHAYQLKKDAPEGEKHSISMQDAVVHRFGPGRFAAKQARMAQLGESEGFNFTFAGRIGNTRDSHRVVQLGRAKGGHDMEDRVMKEVMRMFFEEGGDITSWADLVAAAYKAGIPPSETRQWLEAGMGGDEVDKEVSAAENMGVHGVPKFVINGKFEVDGADDVTAFFEQLLQAKENETCSTV